MKTFRNWKTLMLAGIVAMAFNSCLGSDDDDEQKTMTPQEYQSYLTEMSGTYDGKTYFYNADHKVDSINIVGRIVGVGDSTITLSPFPARALARCVKDSVIRKAIEAEPDFGLKMKFYINAFNNGRLYYGVYPLSVTFEDVEYRDAQHDLTFNFVTYLNNEGVYMNKMTDLNFYLLDMFEDGRSLEQYYSVYNSYGYDNGYYTFVASLKKRNELDN
jgi:hypothetical protein